MAECRHTVTRGREGEPSGRSWCVSCGDLVLDVHTRPCGECAHFRRLSTASICTKKLMAVSAEMRVCFYVKPEASRHGLCFEEPGGPTPTTDERKKA